MDFLYAERRGIACMEDREGGESRIRRGCQDRCFTSHEEVVTFQVNIYFLADAFLSVG